MVWVFFKLICWYFILLWWETIISMVKLLSITFRWPYFIFSYSFYFIVCLYIYNFGFVFWKKSCKLKKYYRKYRNCLHSLYSSFKIKPYSSTQVNETKWNQFLILDVTEKLNYRWEYIDIFQLLRLTNPLSILTDRIKPTLHVFVISVSYFLLIKRIKLKYHLFSVHGPQDGRKCELTLPCCSPSRRLTINYS